ncbi:hypothetical protein BU16DRAFT_69205 [Lophium mytilinum]|uniref:Uncharacterized protein n=1 Tax=Lophium mytilinum TaxID=390894 RepID=A0A6A6QQ49_9PEZI|nr:hypothetical protein BU16DRAFT_69205 [Lophium mytilinum]
MAPPCLNPRPPSLTHFSSLTALGRQGGIRHPRGVQEPRLPHSPNLAIKKAEETDQNKEALSISEKPPPPSSYTPPNRPSVQLPPLNHNSLANPPDFSNSSSGIHAHTLPEKHHNNTHAAHEKNIED